MGVALNVPAPGILSNDIGVIAGDTPSLLTGTAHGTITLFSTGEIFYQPFAGFFGVDSFQYRILSVVNSNAAIVTIQVGVNAVPLPAALPLFATGLGALGLFGWRRKRKAEAIAA